MDDENAIDYVKSHTDADRLRLLDEIASGVYPNICTEFLVSNYVIGMEYLHASNIVHGDLRGVCIYIPLHDELTNF